MNNMKCYPLLTALLLAASLALATDQPTAAPDIIKPAAVAGKKIQRLSVEVVDGMATIQWPEAFTGKYQVVINHIYQPAAISKITSTNCVLTISKLKGQTKKIPVVGVSE